ncbi:MAG: LacI family DNA-binding transcriptional regulator [Acidobacteria bacterium]|nr:LacI family DNA-binding transcriptional regulator [Acidobacteriota bacterium]
MEVVKRLSIKDIAKTASVSNSTVSRALRNSPLVNRETGELIRKLAEEAGYRPSAAARSLVTRRTDTIGVVVTNISDPFVAGVVSGIEDAAEERGYSVFLANSNAEPAREKRVVRSFEERRVDGIIVTSSRVGALHVPMLTQMEVPLVLLNNQHPSEAAHSVMIDNEGGSYAAAMHLARLGHKRIGYIGDRYGHQSDAERHAGYERALAEMGIAFDAALSVRGDGKPEGARAALGQLLELREPPTAVFCYNDMSALGAVHEARARGLRVPEDLSLVGFDDLYISQYLNPPLTTVRQPMAEMGRLATHTLLRLIMKEASSQIVKVPGELIVRASTCRPRETR